MFAVKNNQVSFLERLRSSIPKYEGYSMRAHVEGSTAPETMEFKPSLGLNRKYNKDARKSYQNESSQASEF